MPKDKEFCSNHDCVINEIDHLKEDNRELKSMLKQVSDEIKSLSTHEKIFVAFIGFAGVAISAGGSILGTILVNYIK